MTRFCAPIEDARRILGEYIEPVDSARAGGLDARIAPAVRPVRVGRAGFVFLLLSLWRQITLTKHRSFHYLSTLQPGDSLVLPRT